MKRNQLNTFISNWDTLGLSSVTNTVPITTSDAGQHAWVTMSNAFSDPNCNKNLAAILEELAKYPEETLLAKKHSTYLIALVNVGNMERSETFLKV